MNIPHEPNLTIQKILTGCLILALCLFTATPAIKAQEVEQVFKIFSLRYAEPEPILSVLTTMMAGKQLKMDIDRNSGKVLVYGPQDDLRTIEDLIVQLDVPSDDLEAEDIKPVFKVFNLKHADTVFAFRVLQTMLAGRTVTLDMDSKANRILVAGSPEDLDRVEQLIRQLDVAPKVQTRTEMFEVSDGRASEVADIVKQLTASDGPGSLDGEVRIAVEPNSNALIVSGKEDDVAIVREMLSELLKASKAEAASAPAVSCAVRISWLVDSTHISESGFLDEPNASLVELVDALQNQQVLNGAKVITSTQTVVQVRSDNSASNGEFNTSSLRNFSGSNGIGQVSVNAQGSLTTTANGKFLLNLTMDVADRENPISIGTTLTLPKNHPVAFSVSDVGSFKSAFVVEILDSK